MDPRRAPTPQRKRLGDGGSTVPTSWTTVFTVQPNTKTTITWSSFVATDSTAYTVQVRLLSPAAVGIPLAQAVSTGTGWQWRPFKGVTSVTIDSGWSVQIIGSGGGTINVAWYMSGEEEWFPS